MITFSCDDAGAYASLSMSPAADHKPGETIAIEPRGPDDKRPPGKIPQVAHTYKVLGFMNEHQLAISETTFTGRPELQNLMGMIDCGKMIYLALQRARTAREAIGVITGLIEEYGYGDAGESLSIADTQEAWILEVVGTGAGGKGAAWVAMRIPDGQVSCHCNSSRIGEFPRNDPANCLYSANVESYAVSKGWYDAKSGQPFRFGEAYAPATPLSRRICDTRVWSILRRAAPSLHLSPDYHRGKPDSKPYPFSVKPDAKLAAADVFALMRDHLEGTEFDMTQGVDAGPFGMPRRWRPLAWKVDGVEYAWERPVSPQQTAFTYVSQSRSWLPDPVGGLYWYGVDDAYTSCYIPLYCGIDALPKSYVGGSSAKFSWDSAWWVFNIVSNYTYQKWSSMIPEVLACQKDIESNFLALQPAVEKTAVELMKTSPNLAVRYLTDYSVMHGEQTAGRWRELAEHLITKYNDGYVRDAKNEKALEVGYPEAWLRRVLKERPEHFKLPVEAPKK
jgi:dipeptidase